MDLIRQGVIYHRSYGRVHMEKLQHVCRYDLYVLFRRRIRILSKHLGMTCTEKIANMMFEKYHTCRSRRRIRN